MKKIIAIVFGVHIAIFLWIALWLPKEQEKKTLQVRTTVNTMPIFTPPKSASIERPTSEKKQIASVKKVPLPKKTIAKKNESIGKKTPTIPAHLLKDLENAIAKIDQKSHKEMPRTELNAPKILPPLHVEQKTELSFANELIHCLQKTLDLPEKGEVKIKLTLSNKGKFVHLIVLESASVTNQEFLERELKKIHFPPFEGDLKKENEHAFVLTFCNR